MSLRHSILAVACALTLHGAHAAEPHEGYDKALQAYSCVDYPKAIGLFKTYADQGHALSQYMMGIMVEQGQGVPSDVAAAFAWYMRAAQQGIPDAYYALADMYAKGISVAADKSRAFAWYELARQGGHNLAPDMLKTLEPELKPEQKAEARNFIDTWLAKLGKP